MTEPERFSGLDDEFYDVTLTDASTGAAITTGTVTMRLCDAGTTTALGGLSASSQSLTHVAAGRWTGVHDDASVLAAIASLAVGQSFDRVLLVAGLAARTMAACRRVRVVDSSR